MSRTFRRIKFPYEFYGFHKRTRGWIFKSIFSMQSDVVLHDAIRYFSDNYKSNNRMLNTTARQMMRAEARTRIAQEFRKYKQSEDWDNYCTILYDKYSDPWNYD